MVLLAFGLGSQIESNFAELLASLDAGIGADLVRKLLALVDTEYLNLDASVRSFLDFDAQRI